MLFLLDMYIRGQYNDLNAFSREMFTKKEDNTCKHSYKGHLNKIYIEKVGILIQNSFLKFSNGKL